MKALVLTAPSVLELQEIPTPEPGLSEVLVRVALVGICGSDVHGYTGATGRRLPPIVMGHEAVGTVAALGPGARSVVVGDAVCFDSTLYCAQCVACREGQYNRCTKRLVLGVSTPDQKRQGAMAEYVVLPAYALHKLPDGLSYEHAALAEPLSIGLHAARRAGDLAGKTVLILGAGTIGLCTLMAVRQRDARHVTITDLKQDRLQIAEELGADCAQHVAGERAETLPSDVDVTFDVVGSAASLRTAVQQTRSGGTLVLIGNSTQNPPVDVQTVIAKELTLTGSYASAGEFAEALDAMHKGVLDPRPLISGTYPLEEGAAWFKRLHAGEEGLLKVLLRP